MMYSPEIQRSMQMFYLSLSEKDRRRYAAIEAAKLGYGYIGPRKLDHPASYT